ncbi:MAG: hypothetical protein K9K67_14830, partial [Bacteriovoracaceae bacterium]|nr:hypothetical protein [Bacteriovoracaceae bacterium]
MLVQNARRHHNNIYYVSIAPLYDNFFKVDSNTLLHWTSFFFGRPSTSSTCSECPSKSFDELL